ncbi:MAG TPA: hypothetical protein VFT93_07300 [Candidatus Eisenbacteria bacterium]|nr:hypothetical protein [Candidatus Eisenbacteria bacterium]
MHSAPDRVGYGRVLPAKAANSVRPGTPRRGGGIGGRLFLTTLVALPVLATAVWLPYYLAPVGQRVRHPLHELLRPSGDVGQSFGVLALALLLFLWLYPFRRMLGSARGLGSVGGWLRIHTFAGMAIPLIAAVHAGWRFSGLIGLGYFAMLIVSLSGYVGRYLYTRIPRSRTGIELTRDEIAGRRRALITEIADRLQRSPEDVERALQTAARTAPVGGTLGAIRRLLSDDVARWRAAGALRREWGASRTGARPVDPKTLRQAVRLARDEIRLAQQARLLEATQRVFRYWHVAHRPVAITGLLAVLIHVGVAFAMGRTWLH